jgi:hypothetical protein
MTKKYKSLFGAAALSMAVLSVSAGVNRALADDNTGTKINNAAEDAKTNTSKTVRKGKKTARNATGTNSVSKNAQDTANDTKNDAENRVNKMKNEANQ